MDIHFQGIWRMDWGFGNPNKTAAFIALLMIAIWTLPLIRNWLFWVVLPAFTTLGICLMHTMSRGGFIAALVGLGIALSYLPRPWPKSHIVAFCLSVAIIFIGAERLQTTARFADSYQDRSITNRLQIWKCVPQMIVDAPFGWGVGQAGNAFLNWYQPIGSNERYRTLVNSHFTWLVEFGWPLRLVYIFGWACVFVLCYSNPEQSSFGIALGLWIAFFIASFFSSVAEIPWLWALPVIGLGAVIVLRFRRKIWPSRTVWFCVFGAAASLLTMLYILGCLGPRRAFSIASGNSICFNSKNPDIWVIISPLAAAHTVSVNYPRNLREYCKEMGVKPHIGIVPSVAALPDIAGDKLVVIGPLCKQEWKELSDRAQSCQKLLLVSPNVFSTELNIPEGVLEKTTVLFGEFSVSPTASSWGNTTGKCQRVEGVGDYFQNWPEVVFTALK